MDDKIDPAEYRNPELTLRRRMVGAGLESPAPKQEPKGDMPQTQFTRAKPPTSAEKARQDKQFEAIMRKRAEDRKAKGYAKGGVTRGDGCAQRGKTRGKVV